MLNKFALYEKLTFLEVILINIIVTGGAGFIGSNFIFHMLAKYPNYRIICLDKLTYAGNLATLQPVMDKLGFRFVQADICDREAVNRLFEEEKPDIVVNFVAESHVDRSIENPGIFLQTNIMGTAVLMDACRKYGIRRYHRTYDLPVTISRCSNNYGPYQFPEKIIPLMLVNALQDKQLPVYGTGMNVRDWLYVEDHC